MMNTPVVTLRGVGSPPDTPPHAALWPGLSRPARAPSSPPPSYCTGRPPPWPGVFGPPEAPAGTLPSSEMATRVTFVRHRLHAKHMLAPFRASGHQCPYIYVGKLRLGEGTQHSKTEAPAAAHLEQPVSGPRHGRAAWVGGQRSHTRLLPCSACDENALSFLSLF